MKPNPLHRLPAPLEGAVQRLKLAAREAAERTIEALGLAALASNNAFQRDELLGAQFELNRKSAMFALAFNDAFDERLQRELGPRAVPGSPTAPVPLAATPTKTAPTDWAALSLVEDKEVELQISADRFGMDIAHACEWELRELDGYVATLLADAGGAAMGERNPLRPDVVGHAMMRGIEAASERPEIRKVLATEFSRTMATLLPPTYAHIVGELRNAGVQPQGMAVRNRVQRAGAAGSDDDSRHGSTTSVGGQYTDSRRGVSTSGFVTSASTLQHGMPGARRGGGSLGQIDAGLMNVIRRLAHAGGGGGGGGGGSSVGRASGGDPIWSDFGTGGWAGAGPPPNLIHAHREELRQASSGQLDHMVIDVIGFLFDQILADPKVPPQMARQIARLQLPVLRAALGDPAFFSSRRHPVRRFVNRIASLGAAFEDMEGDAAKALVAKVKALVNEVVEGDFEQLEVYDHKLAALEAFTAELAAREVRADDGADAAAVLAEKEDQLRLRQLYALRLEGELKDLSAPAFLRDFITGVWSQVLLRAAEQGGAEGPLAQRLRVVGRELYLSVQPKPTPAHRKQFLAELPKLMQELTEGMNLIRWPEAERRAFFGQLMPAHAEALKSAPVRTLDINLMARKVDGALQRPLPSRDDARAAPLPPVLTDEIAVAGFSSAEAEQVGLVKETAVDWSRGVDIDLGAEPPLPPDAVAMPALPGLPAAAAEAAEPTEGRELAGHLQVGFAYRMHLEGDWQKVRLSHVSPGRSFFIFTHGAKQRRTVSLTQRMLIKLCETGRLKAFESAYLIERATARARRQLAGVAASA